MSTEIQAQNDEEARHQGRERIEEACYFFEFCLGGSMLLDPNQEELPVRVLGRDGRVPLVALEEVLFRDEGLRFRGGGGRVRFVPE